MIFTAALFAFAIAQQGPALVCPITGEAPMDGAKAFEYAGTTTVLCCMSCPSSFKANPAKAYKTSADQHLVVAQFLFDPVNGGRVDPKKAKGSSDYNGIRFSFGTAQDKKDFDADPKKFGTLPAKEALFCPVEMHAIKNYSSAGGFVDYNGVRYYVCCDDCLMQMNQNPAKFAANAEKYILEPKVIAPSK